MAKVTLDGTWQAITPEPGTKSALWQNPAGNAAVFVTQRILAAGVDETDILDCEGISIAADSTMSIGATGTLWVKGTNTQIVTVCFFRHD